VTLIALSTEKTIDRPPPSYPINWLAAPPCCFPTPCVRKERSAAPRNRKLVWAPFSATLNPGVSCVTRSPRRVSFGARFTLLVSVSSTPIDGFEAPRFSLSRCREHQPDYCKQLGAGLAIHVAGTLDVQGPAHTAHKASAYPRPRNSHNRCRHLFGQPC